MSRLRHWLHVHVQTALARYAPLRTHVVLAPHLAALSKHSGVLQRKNGTSVLCRRLSVASNLESHTALLFRRCVGLLS